MTGMEPLASMLIEYIARNRLRHEDLADQIGVSAPTIGRWCNGTRSPSFEFAIAMSKVMGLSLDELAGLRSADPDRVYLEQKIAKHGPSHYQRQLGPYASRRRLLLS